MSEHLVDIQHERLSFFTPAGEVKALNDVSIHLNDGEVLGIVGESGSGKSVTAYSLMGLTAYPGKLVGGTIDFNGHRINDLSEKEFRKIRGNEVSIIFQDPMTSLNPVYTIGNQIMEVILLHTDKNKEQARARAKELLELVGLGDKMNAKPRNLSGGQKQRVAVARALTMDPKILLCDEATSALDPKTTNSILDLLMEINQKLGITVIIVTHQMEVVRKACNKACILENGKIADEGTVKEIFIKQPQSLKRLLGEETVKLPDEGHNIQIAHLVNNIHDGELFAKMSKELNYVFPILDGKIQDYQNDSMGIFTINVDNEHLKFVADYLTKEGLNWHEIETQCETKEDEE